MDTQALTFSATICNLPVAPAEEPVHAFSRDYGFDFDEDELARELLAPIPANLTNQPLPEVEADEFEGAFQYFFS